MFARVRAAPLRRGCRLKVPVANGAAAVIMRGFLLPHVALYVYKMLLPNLIKKARNKEVSAHVQLWDPCSTQSGLDAKDL